MNRDTYPNPRGAEAFLWDAGNSLLAVPYQWTLLGIGFRTDVLQPADVEQGGWEIFRLASYTNPISGITHDLRGRKLLLDSPRDVLSMGMKAAGWQEQLHEGLPPTAMTDNPESPYNGRFQWSSNEVEEARLRTATDWLLGFREEVLFNTPQQGPWLVSDTVHLTLGWSSSVMYAIRPNSSQHLPIDFLVPRQGSAVRFDSFVIPRTSGKLWLAHQFIDYILDPRIHATVSSWALSATPNAWAFGLMRRDQIYSFSGVYPNGTTYT